jgi:hypothetical protein
MSTPLVSRYFSASSFVTNSPAMTYSETVANKYKLTSTSYVTSDRETVTVPRHVGNKSETLRG